MSATITLGREDGYHREVQLDLDALLRTRLLVQASSGGGKSWALRRLAEQAIPRVQTIILDPEGEFATLRERFDVILAGKGGDTPIDVRSAALLAHRLLEHGASAVCDLFECAPSERHRWVAAFLTALVDAPKTLWRPALVIVDEAHMFAPERGAGDSVASEPVTALATRGRKRGFCAVLATQRLGKLRKDTAAELQNVLIGRTVLDLDRDRAADALGVKRADRREFDQDLKTLAPGKFFGFGRAFIGKTEPELFTVGGVVTTHPEPGAQMPEPPPPTAAIRHLLPQLADLPAEAERKEQTEADLRREIADLRRELAVARQAVPPPAPPVRVEVPVVFEEDLKEFRETFSDAVLKLTAVRDAIEGAAAKCQPSVARHVSGHRALSPTVVHPSPPPRQATPANGKITRDGAWRMLRVLAARHPKPLTRIQVATLAGFTASGGTFQQYLGMLKSAGYVTADGQHLVITAEGLGAAGDVPRPNGPQELLAMWREKFDRKGVRDMLDLLAREHGPMTKEQIAGALGMEVTGGTFQQYLGKLRGHDLVMKTRGGFAVNPELAL